MVGGPIFVVGAPRTGTTLMREMLSRHDDVYVFNELHFFERIWDARDRVGPAESDADLLNVSRWTHGIVAAHGTESVLAKERTPEQWMRAAREVGGGYGGVHDAVLRSAAEVHGASRWGDSSPQDVLYLATLFAWQPSARVIAMVRDPRAFLASYKNYQRRAEATYRERYNPLTVSLLWRSYMTALREALAGPHASAIHVQTYEGLVDDPERAMRAVCDHCGLDYRPEMLRVERANSSYERGPGRPGISAASRDRWRQELEPTEKWLVQRICAAPMAAFGHAVEDGLRPRPAALLRIGLQLPGRLYNMLFRGRKTFRLGKLRRVLSGLLGRARAQ